MEVYNESGKTKTGELRISRAIGALLITSSRKVEELTNERITIYIERANGGNIELASNISLKHFILGSTYGNTVIKADTAGGLGLSALCEIALNGAIGLAPNESIKVSLDGLISSATYSINGIEYPQGAETVITLERKTILGDETEKTYATGDADLLLLDVALVTDVEMTFSNGVRTKYTKKELIALAFDVEHIITANVDGNISLSTGDVLAFPLNDVNIIDIEKGVGTVELTLLTY